MNKSVNQKGFTLIELMLAMTLFISVMMVATVGFIGINRTFSKGMVRKQLSESVQRVTEDMTRSIRYNGNSQLTKSVVAVSEAESLCTSSVCYVWPIGTAGADGPGGLYRVPIGLISTYATSGTKILDERFVVDYLGVSPVADRGDLSRVKGMFRLRNRQAFIFFEDENRLPEKEKTVCKGTAQEGASQNCALEKFNFVVSTSSRSPTGGGN